MINSCKGKLLISTPDISGDVFSRSVVLVIEHDENGAFGLILNKKLKNIHAGFHEFIGFNAVVYEGGPVEHDKVFFIIKGKPFTENYMEIDGGFYFTGDIQLVFEALSDGKLSKEDVKIFCGYSGWSSHQLESELSYKIWTVIDSYNFDYTASDQHNLWKSIMQNLGGNYLLWANSPEDISMN